MNLKDRYTYEVKKEKDGVVTISVQATSDLYKDFKEQAYQKLAPEVKIPGFRPGKAPRTRIEAKLGNDLYSETIKILLPEVASDIVDKEGLNPVTQLEYDIQKFSDNDGVEFSFTFSDYPEVKLPDIKKLTVEIEEEQAVEDQEVIDVIQRLYSSEEQNEEDFDISKVSDEMVTKWDIDGAKTLKDLKEKIKERLTEVKHQQYHQQLEMAILDKVVSESKFDVPAALIEQQSKALLDQHLSRIDELQMERDKFLEAQGLTLEKLKEQKNEEAKQQIEADLVLNQVAKELDVIPSAEDIQAQIDGVEDEETKERLSSYNGRRYVLSTLIKSNAIKALEETVTIKNKKSSAKKSKAE